jgi:hypothetical protein
MARVAQTEAQGTEARRNTSHLSNPIMNLLELYFLNEYPAACSLEVNAYKDRDTSFTPNLFYSILIKMQMPPDTIELKYQN